MPLFLRLFFLRKNELSGMLQGFGVNYLFVYFFAYSCDLSHHVMSLME